jgi:hypothetical protein
MGVEPAELAAEIVVPVEDRLGVLAGTAPVVRDGWRVTVAGAALASLADRWAASPWPEQAGLDALHFQDGTWRTANWILLLDALNFCFWGEPGGPRWRVEWCGRTYDGYYALAAALSRALDEGYPLWDAAHLNRMDASTLATILRPIEGDPPMPLFEQRLANAREVGAVLLERYAGRFSSAVTALDGDAVALAHLLARNFSSFDDVARWHGAPVPFYKRAQICVADLAAAFQWQGIGALQHLDELTAFADYKLPQLLRQLGALVYADELAVRVDAYDPLTAGSEEEIEIRAGTIWAVQLLERRLAARGIARSASELDYRLWVESQGIAGGARPYHRTRTIYY